VRQPQTESLDPEAIKTGPPTSVILAYLRIIEPGVLATPSPVQSPLPEQIELAVPRQAGPPPDRFRHAWRKHLTAESDFSGPSADHGGALRNGEAVGKNTWSPGHFAYIPRYLLLLEMSPEGMRERILDSDALPEFFPRRALQGEDLVDGGVADNTPLLPLLDAGVKNVVFVYLDRQQGLENKPARERQLEQDRIAARRVGSEREPNPLLLPTTTVPLLRIVPSVSLGSLPTGALNFSSKKAQSLIRLGYADTLDALETGLVEWTI
jgi:hypothetical protein